MVDANDIPERLAEWTTEELRGELDRRRRETDAIWQSLDMQEVELAAVVQRAIDASLPAAREARVAIDFTASETEFRFKMDAAKIEQVIGQLLSNAAGFSPEGSTVTVICEPAALPLGRRSVDSNLPAVSVSISDESHEFPVADVSELFGNFVQSYKSKGAEDGSDFGLSRCKDIVESHRGRIWANRKLMGGVVVIFSLPCVS